MTRWWLAGDDGEAVMSVYKGKVREGKLFWLTAYVQLGNCILKYFEPE